MSQKMKTRRIVQLALLIALTVVVQAGGFPQPVTGPLVNFLLFSTAGLFGIWPGIILGSVTPIFALLRGQLPAILAPMVPFIILANAALVICFGVVLKFFSKKSKKQQIVGQITGIGLSSVVKFLLLTTSAQYIVPFVFGKTFPPPVLMAMAFPQLITALGGGFLFLMVYHVLSLDKESLS